VSAPSALPHISPLLLRWFVWYTRRYAAKHFHSIRVNANQSFETSGPLVVYANHPSWWDPIVCLQLAVRLFPDRKHYAAMDTEALRRYRFFTRLGFFPAQPASYSGARQFLTSTREILERADSVLWVTAQGRFADVRERPLKLLPGVAHIANAHSFTAIPLALEYRLGTERSADAYARFGEPFSASSDLGAFESRLQRCMDELSHDVISGAAEHYAPMLAGSAGTTAPYELWQRLRSRLAGERYHPEHGTLLRRGEA
jgi:1-acyl-sn-glycerol-3-phosphate acyltransferase